MFDVSRDDGGLVHLTVSGLIDSTEMRDGLDRFLEVIGEDGEFDVLYVIRDISFPTPGAIAVECGYLPKMFGLLRRMRRVALIANQDWVRTAAKVESALIPGLVIEVFRPGDEAAARAYLAGETTAA